MAHRLQSTPCPAYFSSSLLNRSNVLLRKRGKKAFSLDLDTYQDLTACLLMLW